MQKIQTLARCVYREKSSTTGQLVEAMSKATAEFLPLQYDQTGTDEDGRDYRYASLSAINRATKKALSDNGLWLHCDYGFDESGIYAVAVLEHTSGEFVASTLPIPPYVSIHRQKAAMTLMRRAAVEGLLGLSAEAEDDANCCQTEDAQAASPAIDPKFKAQIDMARQAILAADSEERIAEILSKVNDKIERGRMPAECRDELDALANTQRTSIAMYAEEALS